MTHLPPPTQSAISCELEGYIRHALTLGELSPGTAARIQTLISTNSLSASDHRLLAILQDAIGDGCVQLIKVTD